MPSYPFLAQPPPPRSHRRSRSSTIYNWQAKVVPGTPTSIVSTRVYSASFISTSPLSPNYRIVTPLSAEFKPDLAALGYSFCFVEPVTPVKPTKTLSKFRSLSSLKPMPKTETNKPAPVEPKPKPKKKKGTRPPPLANELALMQFTGGGKLEDHAERVMHKKAKGGETGVAVVHKDETGALWWDEEERFEYERLLNTPSPSWVQFRTPVTSSTASFDLGGLVRPLEDERGRAIGPIVPCFITSDPFEVKRKRSRRRSRSRSRNRSSGTPSVAPAPPPQPQPKPKGNARRRPPPLNLPPATKSNTQIQNEGYHRLASQAAVEGAREFAQSSFNPRRYPASPGTKRNRRMGVQVFPPVPTIPEPEPKKKGKFAKLFRKKD